MTNTIESLKQAHENLECRLAAVIISLREKIARAAFRVESNENGSVTIADEQGRARRVLLRGERWEA